MEEIVDQRTGETNPTNEHLDKLRKIEEEISIADADIAELKDQLKAARDARDTLVERLRAAVRDGKVLPLFDGLDNHVIEEPA